MPAKEALQFEYQAAVDAVAAGNAFGTTVPAGYRRYVYYVEGYSTTGGGALRLDVGYTNDDGATYTIREMMNFTGADVSHWRPGYEDSVKEKAGPIFVIPAGYNFFAVCSANTCEVFWKYEDRQV